MDLSHVYKRVENYIASGVMPGANFAVLADGCWQETVCGSQSLWPQSVPLVSGKLWDIASVSKVVGVGTVCIDKWLAGELDIDEPLQALYPNWSSKRMSVGKAEASVVTIRQLLTHTSGIDPFIKNRATLNREQLSEAMNQLTVRADKTFHYTDVNFILLGFMLEKLLNQSLSEIFRQQIFNKWQLTDTTFGPVAADRVVPTSQDVPVGRVHDPKARVLGEHCGSAGLFSTLSDLTKFVDGYLADTRYLQLLTDFTENKQQRSLAWAMTTDRNWLMHTGYTGPFLLVNLRRKQAVVFLTNRVHEKDDRAQWINDRNVLIDDFITSFK